MPFPALGTANLVKAERGRHAESEAIADLMKDRYPGHLVVCYYDAPVVEYGLLFGNAYTPVFGRDLENMRGERVFYRPRGRYFHG